MNQILELPASLLHALEQQAEASGTTPQGWIAARLAEANPGVKDGCNCYSAPAPNREAVDKARRFWEVMKEEGQQPTRVAASAVGGVGITQRRGERTVYVEFLNAGSVHALLTDDASEGQTHSLEATKEAFRTFLARAKAFLDG